MTPITPIDAFFLAWCEATSQEPDKRIIRQNEHLAHDFIAAGFTCDELKRVVAYMKHENTKGGRFKLQLHKVAGELDRFASILADCKARDRNRRPAPSAKAQALETLRPTVEPETADVRANGTGRHLKDILSNLGESTTN